MSGPRSGDSDRLACHRTTIYRTQAKPGKAGHHCSGKWARSQAGGQAQSVQRLLALCLCKEKFIQQNADELRTRPALCEPCCRLCTSWEMCG